MASRYKIYNFHLEYCSLFKRTFLIFRNLVIFLNLYAQTFLPINQENINSFIQLT